MHSSDTVPEVYALARTIASEYITVAQVQQFDMDNWRVAAFKARVSVPTQRTRELAMELMGAGEMRRVE